MNDRDFWSQPEQVRRFAERDPDHRLRRLVGDRGLTPVEGREHLWRGFSAGPLLLLEADELDREARRSGLVPERPTRTVEAEHDGGTRVTVNALYRREPDGP